MILIFIIYKLGWWQAVLVTSFEYNPDKTEYNECFHFKNGIILKSWMMMTKYNPYRNLKDLNKSVIQDNFYVQEKVVQLNFKVAVK